MATESSPSVSSAASSSGCEPAVMESPIDGDRVDRRRRTVPAVAPAPSANGGAVSASRSDEHAAAATSEAAATVPRPAGARTRGSWPHSLAATRPPRTPPRWRATTPSAVTRRARPRRCAGWPRTSGGPGPARWRARSRSRRSPEMVSTTASSSWSPHRARLIRARSRDSARVGRARSALAGASMGDAGGRRASGWTSRAVAHDGPPWTMVSRAASGPQRSHASTGSAMAPANAGPVSDHTATSPTAPGASTPSSPLRPRQRGAAERRHLQRHPRRAGRRAVAQLGQQHRLARLQPQRRRVGRRRAVDAEPDGHARRPQVDDRGDARRRGSGCSTGSGRRRRRPRRAGAPRPASGITQWASQARSLSQPVRSRYSVGRQPNVASENSSSSRVLGEVGVQAHVEPLGELGRSGPSAPR